MERLKPMKKWVPRLRWRNRITEEINMKLQELTETVAGGQAWHANAFQVTISCSVTEQHMPRTAYCKITKCNKILWEMWCIARYIAF